MLFLGCRCFFLEAGILEPGFVRKRPIVEIASAKKLFQSTVRKPFTRLPAARVSRHERSSTLGTQFGPIATFRPRLYEQISLSCLCTPGLKEDQPCCTDPIFRPQNKQAFRKKRRTKQGQRRKQSRTTRGFQRTLWTHARQTQVRTSRQSSSLSLTFY